MINPLKISLKTEGLSLALVILSLIFGFYFYQYFPASVPSHWGLNGEVNGYSSRAVGAFMLPVMMVGMYLLFLVLPCLDPKKDQYISFAPTYREFKDLLVIFLFILFLMMGLNALGQIIAIGFWVPIMIGILFVKIGWLLRGVKMNWFIGIRTPWTLSSETVWNKTHQASGWVFTVSGALMAATVLASGQTQAILFIAAILFLVITLPLYSYLLYVQEKKVKK